MRVLDLFSGIGGFSLGLERAGFQTVAFCEYDDFCQKVLKKHWPDIPIHTDIKELDGHEYRGAVELVCGGFPCQPYSVAGKRGGASDDRALWKEMFRVIREIQPAYVLGENVPGIISIQLDDVLSDLESEGYATQSFIIPACGVDARHRRDRVWIVAYAERYDWRRGGGAEPQGRHPRVEHRSGGAGFGKREPDKAMANANRDSVRRGRVHGDLSDEGWGARTGRPESLQSQNRKAHLYHPQPRSENVADTDSDGVQGCEVKRSDGENGTQPSHEQSQRLGRSGHKLSNPRGSVVGESQPGLGGVADGFPTWLDEPRGLSRIGHGIPRRKDRLKALGNAVVPQVVEIIGRNIKSGRGGLDD
tara:strand:- start:618 stop:1700 length:1083 start_codon:yes stop_codon:yes gene_type:complete